MRTLKTLIKTTLIAAAITLISSTAAQADQPLYYDTACEQNFNGLAFTEDNVPYICNMSLNHSPFIEFQEFSGGQPDVWSHYMWYPLIAYEDGSYNIDILSTETGARYRFGYCGKSSWGCLNSHYDPDGHDDVPPPNDVRDTALDYLTTSTR